MSSALARNGASAWTRTWYTRPKRLKSFTYSEPRYTCIVLNTSVTETPNCFAFTRSRSTFSCGTLI